MNFYGGSFFSVSADRIDRARKLFLSALIELAKLSGAEKFRKIP